ncbi:MAG: MBG domain-containing protein [Luteolibacter sp.]
MNILRAISFLSACVTTCAVCQQVQFNNLSQEYNGTPRYPEVLLNGQPHAADFLSREIDPVSTPVVFNNIPNSLALSYVSLSFSAEKTSELGNLVQLAGSARVADYVEVVMVTWATAAQYPAMAAKDATGYRHPITATLYNLQTTQDGTTLTQLEQSTAHVQIPWRPTTLPNGSPYPYNGYAFKALIPLSAGVTVPDTCLISIGFNTQNSGTSPLGVSGPYNALNLALSSLSPTIGTDTDPNAVFWVTKGASYYPASNWGGVGSPMLRLAARESALPQPSLLAATQPLRAGSYHVQAQISSENVVASTVVNIAQAPASIQVTDLTRSVGSPNSGITVSTEPSGLSVSVTYGGATQIPTQLGRYPVAVQINERDYFGSWSGEFHRSSLAYDEWHLQQFGIPSDVNSDGASDPDSDGFPNQIEYAMGSNPHQSDAHVEFTKANEGMKVIFKQRREMNSMTLSVEASADLTNWLPVVSTVESSEDLWETRSVPSNADRKFFRFKVAEN